MGGKDAMFGLQVNILELGMYERLMYAPLLEPFPIPKWKSMPPVSARAESRCKEIANVPVFVKSAASERENCVPT